MPILIRVVSFGRWSAQIIKYKMGNVTSWCAPSALPVQPLAPAPALPNASEPSCPSWGHLLLPCKIQQDAPQGPWPPLSSSWAGPAAWQSKDHPYWPVAFVSSTECDIPCHDEEKHRQGAGGEEACLTAGDPSCFPFHHHSFIWIRVSSLLNPLFAVCYSTCTQSCAFIFISSNCFPVLMGSHYSHTIERKCIH